MATEDIIDHPEAIQMGKIIDHLKLDPGKPVSEQILNTKFLTTTPCLVDLNELNQIIKRNGGYLEMNVVNKDGEELDLTVVYGLSSSNNEAVIFDQKDFFCEIIDESGVVHWSEECSLSDYKTNDLLTLGKEVIRKAFFKDKCFIDDRKIRINSKCGKISIEKTIKVSLDRVELV